MAKGKSAAERKHEKELAHKAAQAETWAGVVKTGLRCAAAVGIAWMFKGSAEAFAGQVTITNLALTLPLNIKVGLSLASTTTIGSIVWGFRERHLRKATIKRLAPLAEKYEQIKDPKRTSSRLTLSGDTNPEDAE